MSLGRARNLLVRKLLRELLQYRHAGQCLRCGDLIKEDDEFHLDHIESWEMANDPADSYLDPANVAFSHAICNTIEPTIETRLTSIRRRTIG